MTNRKNNLTIYRILIIIIKGFTTCKLNVTLLSLYTTHFYNIAAVVLTENKNQGSERNYFQN